MQITLWAVVDSYKQLKDRGMKITLETWELEAEQVLGLHSLYNKAVYVAIGENPMNFEDIQDQLPKAIQQRPKGKSPSQRLRSVLYLLREQAGSKGDKNDHYESMMERIIEFYRQKLD